MIAGFPSRDEIIADNITAPAIVTTMLGKLSARILLTGPSGGQSNAADNSDTRIDPGNRVQNYSGFVRGLVVESYYLQWQPLITEHRGDGSTDRLLLVSRGDQYGHPAR